MCQIARIVSVSVCTALLMTSCAASPQVLGSYADKLTYADIVEIRTLVKDRPDLRPIFRVWMHWPDRAFVDSGNPWRPDTIITTFIVYKRSGHWNIDEASIERERPLVTGDLRLTNRWSQPLAGVLKS
jgi:hypothetical protein